MREYALGLDVRHISKQEELASSDVPLGLRM